MEKYVEPKGYITPAMQKILDKGKSEKLPVSKSNSTKAIGKTTTKKK